MNKVYPYFKLQNFYYISHFTNLKAWHLKIKTIYNGTHCDIIQHFTHYFHFKSHATSKKISGMQHINLKTTCDKYNKINSNDWIG